MTQPAPRQVVRLAWGALAVNLVVILLGALVRATGSGSGCGRSWPTCEGKLIPSRLEGATLIEFSHRAISGIALLVVIGLLVSIRRRPESTAMLRRAAWFAVVTIVIEALIGAGIVLFEWVVDDSSVARTIAVPLHLVNTLLLLAALTAVLVLSDGRRLERPEPEIRRLLGLGIGAMIFVAATGAVTALADTLFPSESVSAGLGEDFSSAASFLTRVRVVHPVVAVGTGILLIWLVSRPPAVRPFRSSIQARSIVWLVVAQVVAGALNVALLVPVPMQLVHLLLADLLWISFVWFGLVATTPQTASISSS